MRAAFLFSETHLEAYRGLSGIDCAAFAAALVMEGRRRPLLALAVGLGLGAKLAYEQLSGAFLFPATGWGEMGEPVLSAHTVGAMAGLASGLIWLSIVLRRHGVRTGDSEYFADPPVFQRGRSASKVDPGPRTKTELLKVGPPGFEPGTQGL